MTNEEAIRELKAMYEHILPYMSIMGTEAYDMAIETLEQEPCDDCISRAWLKEAIHNFFYGLKHTPTEEDIQAYIDVAPSVTPQPKVGEWLKNGELCKCSNCHSNVLFSAVKSYNYCSRCGCRMKGESE